MGKKQLLRSGMDALFSDGTEEAKEQPGKGRPKTNYRQITKTSQIGTKENETRATFIVNEEQLESVKAIAHWERITIKEALTEALELYLKSKKQDMSAAKQSYTSYISRASKEKKDTD